jgi:hypothetical protein
MSLALGGILVCVSLSIYVFLGEPGWNGVNDFWADWSETPMGSLNVQGSPIELDACLYRQLQDCIMHIQEFLCVTMPE